MKFSKGPRIVLCANGSCGVNGVEKVKKEKEFDLTLYQCHVKCNSEESKRALEKSFENMSLGLLGVVVGVIYFSPESCFLIYNCGQKIWTGVNQFKDACRLRNTDLDDVRFVTYLDNYRENSDSQGVGNGSMLEPWKPLDPMKPLDPTFNPIR